MTNKYCDCNCEQCEQSQGKILALTSHNEALRDELDERGKHSVPRVSYNSLLEMFKEERAARTRERSEHNGEIAALQVELQRREAVQTSVMSSVFTSALGNKGNVVYDSLDKNKGSVFINE